MITILDGAMGTALEARGIDTDSALWSATPLFTNPAAISAVHRAYAQAGATVHTAATFRTQPARAGDDAQRLTDQAVQLARQAVPSSHRVAGSMAPIADCYKPNSTPTDTANDHKKMASFLKNSGVDLILVETFANPREAEVATRAAVHTGLEVWTSLTAGFRADLLTPQQLAVAAQAVQQAGASAILVNCIPHEVLIDYIIEVIDVIGDAAPIGAYGNAGPIPIFGDHCAAPALRASEAVARYVRSAQSWVDAGCTILGGCCGTDVPHIIGLHETFTTHCTPAR
jgi:S-methylmethionine-dependent homocysteine/selenocysteine methylase